MNPRHLHVSVSVCLRSTPARRRTARTACMQTHLWVDRDSCIAPAKRSAKTCGWTLCGAAGLHWPAPAPAPAQATPTPAKVTDMNNWYTQTIVQAHPCMSSARGKSCCSRSRQVWCCYCAACVALGLACTIVYGRTSSAIFSSFCRYCLSSLRVRVQAVLPQLKLTLTHGSYSTRQSG